MHRKNGGIILFIIYTLLFTTLQQTNAAPTSSTNDTTLPRFEPGVLYLPDQAISIQDDGYLLSIQGVLGAIVLIICGLMLGVRSIWDRTSAGRHTQSLTGFVTFGFITWIMLTNFEPATTYGSNRQTIYFIVPFIVGFISIFFMAVTIQLYLMLIGGLGAVALGLWILGWKENLAITSSYGRAILLTVLVVVFMILSLYSCFWHKLGAALAGPYIFFMGLDIFFHTGFLYCFTTVLDANANHAHYYQMYRGVYIMQSTLIIAVIVAYVIQGIHHAHIFAQHNIVMGTLRTPDYHYKNNIIRPGYFLPYFPTTWRPTFWNNRSAVVPPPPIAVPAT